MDRADELLLEHPANFAPRRTRRRYSVDVTRDAGEIRDAQRLRWLVFDSRHARHFFGGVLRVG